MKTQPNSFRGRRGWVRINGKHHGHSFGEYRGHFTHSTRQPHDWNGATFTVSASTSGQEPSWLEASSQSTTYDACVASRDRFSVSRRLTIDAYEEIFVDPHTGLWLARDRIVVWLWSSHQIEKFGRIDYGAVPLRQACFGVACELQHEHWGGGRQGGKVRDPPDRACCATTWSHTPGRRMSLV